MCPNGLFGGASPHSNNFPTQCSRHPLRLSARKKSKREGRGGEEKARRRRREEDTEVETTTCHDIGRPPKNSLLLQCLRVCGVCARYAPRNCRKNCLGMRWGICARSGKQRAFRSMTLRSLGMRWVCSAQDLDFCLFLRNG